MFLKRLPRLQYVLCSQNLLQTAPAMVGWNKADEFRCRSHHEVQPTDDNEVSVYSVLTC